MDPNTSPQTMDNLIANLTFGPNEKGPFDDAEIVIFNLDTTQKNTTMTEICQIAAWWKGNTFSTCILPNGGTDLTSKNGFKIRNRKLFHYEKQVTAFSPKEGLQQFLAFLSKLTGKFPNVLLAAHNCSSFHCHIIIRLMKQYGLLDTFKSLVLGFIDTVDAFKATLPERVKENKSFCQPDLENDYLITISEPKHAVVNVKNLVDLIKKINCTDVIMKQHAEDLDEFFRYIDLQPDFDDAVTRRIQKKIAKAGITTDMLKDAYKANSELGVSNLFRGEVDGKVPVKMNKPTIKKINDRVAQLCAKKAGNGTA